MKQKRGIGGWLLFFCISLAILNPLLLLRNVVSSYAEASLYFDQVPGLATVVTIDTILTVVLVTFSIYAGVALWSIQPNAVRTAKRFLFAVLGYYIVAASLPFLSGMSSEAAQAISSQIGKGLVGGLVYFGLWYSYLQRSERVKATYG